VTLNIFDRKFSVEFLVTECVDLVWLHRINSFSLLIDLFAGAQLVPAYFMTF
jgi:hypothetical protein